MRWLSIRQITGSGVFSSHSALCAVWMPHTERENSITAVCSPRQMPKKGSPFSRAQRMALSIPSTPRTPKPPGMSRPW